MELLISFLFGVGVADDLVADVVLAVVASAAAFGIAD